MDIKFTSKQRSALLTEIRLRMKEEPTKVPAGFQTHTASKAEFIEAAQRLGIDLNEYSTPAESKPPRSRLETKPRLQPIAKSQPVTDWTADTEASLETKTDAVMQQPIMDLRQSVLDLLTEKTDLLNKLATRPTDNVVAMPVAGQTVVDVPDPSDDVRDVQQTHTIPAKTVFKGIDDKRDIPVFNDITSPAVDPNYVPDPKLAKAFLSCMSRQVAGHVFLFGPAGTGKSSWPRYWAGMTGRSFWPMAISDDTTVDEFFGSMAARGGTTYWQDGLFLKACRQPYAVILIDEPSAGRADVMLALNGVLQDREFVVPQTGERIKVAEGVQIVLADNTNGRGDATGLYAGTKQMNNSLLSRMAAKIRVGYPSAEQETKVLSAQTGAPKPFCKAVVKFMSECRKAHDRGEAPTLTVSLRESINMTLLMLDGIDPVEAADIVIGNALEPVDQETMHQVLNTHVNLDEWSALLAGQDWTPPAEDSQPEENNPVRQGDGDPDDAPWSV